jgi:hypothetical protein
MALSSRKSRALAYRNTRFWSHVKNTDTCWWWTAAILKTGYGRFSLGVGKAVSAHRYAYEISYGPIPDGLCVCHRCDNKSCVRPSHLFLGTRLDNMQDMIRKGRQIVGVRRRGLEPVNAKLTSRDVLDIRKRFTDGESSKSIAAEYPIHVSYIRQIAMKKCWKHLP